MNRRLADLIMSGAYALVGEPVREHLREFEQSQWLSRADLEALRVRRLRDLLDRAAAHSPYYRRVFAQADLRPADVADVAALARLPILSKDDIRANWAELRAGPSGRTEMRKTSGSTGVPLTFEKSRTTTGAMNALMWRNYGWFGIRIGAPHGRIWAGAPTRFARAKTWVRDRLQNRIRMSSFSMGPKQFDRFIADLFSFRPRYLYGYGQSLYRLAEYANASDKHLERLGLDAVISTAEMITDAQRDVMVRAFGSSVANEYGCTETGIIAMDCPAGSLHLMDDGLVVEIVRDGAPARSGEEGEILVTELFGSFMPLIRYRTGDRGILATGTCSCGRPFRSLERMSGRVTDLLRCPDGVLVDPDVIHPLLKARPEMYAAVKQWRVAQEGSSTIRVTVCTPGAQPRPDIAAYLTERFDELTHGQLRLVFAYEEWLEPKATGKSR